MKGNIVISYSGKDFEISSDLLMLCNVFFENLILNSYDAGATKCEVNISCDESRVVFIYQDNGSGIDRQHIEKVFLPFYTTKASGNGLGMSMCEKMVTALGGSISIDSEVSNGAKFIVKIKDMA